MNRITNVSLAISPLLNSSRGRACSSDSNLPNLIGVKFGEPEVAVRPRPDP